MTPGRRGWIALAGVAIAAGAGASWWMGRDAAARRAADEAAVALFFQQALPDDRAAVYRFDQLRGKPVVINFWATWCPPCVEEMPELSALATELGTERVRFVGVAVDSQANVERFSRQRPVSYPLVVASANGAFLAGRFGNSGGGLPYTVVLDGDGRIRERVLGRVRIESLREVLTSRDFR